MKAEVVSNNLLDLDLMKGSVDPDAYNHEWGINNTIGGWTLLPERVERLWAVLPYKVDVRCLLYAAGYSLSEIGHQESPPVTQEAIRQIVTEVVRPPRIVALRKIFQPQGQGKWRMDKVASVLNSLGNGESISRIATSVHSHVWIINRKLVELKIAGFPIPPVLSASRQSPWNELIGSSEWTNLSKAVKNWLGISLPTLDLLYQTLEREHFRVEIASKTPKQNYYYIGTDEEDHLMKLWEEKPEVFRGRTWTRFNPHANDHLRLIAEENQGSHLGNL